MDFTKFVSLLDTEALFFARADTLGDPFEGSYTTANAQMRSLLEEQHDIPGFFEEIADVRREGRLYHFINSWHWSDFESAAMWSLYLRSGDGIAIQTTFDSLRSALAPAEDPVMLGLVKYIDYAQTPIPEGNVFWPFVHKRQSYEHEREVRAVVARFEYLDAIRVRLN